MAGYDALGPPLHDVGAQPSIWSTRRIEQGLAGSDERLDLATQRTDLVLGRLGKIGVIARLPLLECPRQHAGDVGGNHARPDEVLLKQRNDPAVP
jgi:hypothetical protein